VYDLVTFPLPQPHHYAPALSPAYPWQYFTENGEVREAAHHTRERTATASNEVRETAHEARNRVESAEQNATVSDADIRRVQRKLNDMGYQAGPVDGVYGPRTRDAVRAFQRDKNLHASGRIDDDTLAAMDLNVRGTESPTAGTR
jgi:peptidoglycan hydrolase-like protein with peptidoglycan-binding domain